MSDLCRLIWSTVFALFRSRAALHAEILFLRHQLNVLHRRSPKRVALSNIDRGVCRALLSGSSSARCAENPQAGDGDPLAPRRFPSLLALEITTARWPARDATWDPRAHPRHEYR